MTLSQLGLEDVGALYLGSSLLMADPMGPLLDQDEEEALSPSSFLEEKAPSFSSYASPLSPYQSMSSSPLSSASPPPSPPTHHSLSGAKAGTAQLTLPWLGASDLLDSDARADDGRAEDAFSGMDWMSEKIDLSDFDLDSLIGSCASEEPPSSPEDLLASLDSHMDLDLDPFDTPISAPDDDLAPLPLELSLPLAEESKMSEVAPNQEDALKSEPPSPSPSPSPPSPVYTLELGSEVDVLDAEKNATALTATIIPDPSGTTSPIVLSFPTSAHFVVVLTEKDEPPLTPIPDPVISASPLTSDSDSDSGIDSGAGSPPRLPSPPPPSTPSPSAGSSRTKPYSKPEPVATSPPMAKASRVKSVSGAPKVEKKLKKMEQNKTAATRYRQKKRVEQELLNTECEELEKRNFELAEKAESISREIQYLKDLMEEVRKRRSKSGSVA